MKIALSNITKDLLFAFSFLFAGLLICVFLNPDGLYYSVNAGFSYYGVHWNSIIPFVIGLVGCSYFLFSAARRLSNKNNEYIVKIFLYLICYLSIIIAFTPYTAGRFVSDTHVTSGIILFSTELLLALYITLKMQKDFINELIVILLTLTGLIGLYFNDVPHGYLIQTQIIFQILFCILILRSSNRFIDKHTDQKL